MRKATTQRARPRGSKTRRRRARWRLRLLAAALLLVLAGALYAWWQGQHWRPEEARYPDQGVLVGAGDGRVDFGIVDGLGAQFAYIEASIGADRQDGSFAANFAAAREAGLQVGAVHRFDPCVPADGQSANFVTMVPRDLELLPPAIMLDRPASECRERVPEAAIHSELMTLINQIEAHTGKPVILAPSEEFEERYRIASRFDRNLWLTRSWFEPNYAGRPWLLWTANENFQTEAADQPLRWVVVRP